VAVLALATAAPVAASGPGDKRAKAPGQPNILLVIMDDVGIDQMASFGYGGGNLPLVGLTPPSMPTIDAIAQAGLRFRNTWSMPECSPGRAVLLTGRYPLRTNVLQAIGPNDLANSQVATHEMTAAKLVGKAGYRSAMFGKFHIAGPENNQAGNRTPAALGWDFFAGWTGGLPGSIDTTAGGVAPKGAYTCGFVPSHAQGGADSGACHLPTRDGTTCSMIVGPDAFGDPPGLQCLTRGGILVPDASCDTPPPAELAFDRENAHFVSPLVINRGRRLEEVALTSPRARGYRATIETDAAIDWIRSQDRDQPWMATVSYTIDHTPLQRPPGSLVPSGEASTIESDCTDTVTQRQLSDAMIEAMDTELGRLLVETGIARRGPGGRLRYDPKQSNTMIVIVGDNGSFAPTVKAPFDLARAKATAYQTGVWVPLVVAGPRVTRPGRNVEHMVNIADVFQLFGELGGLDVPAVVPRPIDSVSMLPYLRKPMQSSIRKFNFTQGGFNIQANGGRNGPCVIAGGCSQTPVSKSVCEDNSGVWWGEGADDPDVLEVLDASKVETPLKQCWQVNQAVYKSNPGNYEANQISTNPETYQAVRDDRFKLVRNTATVYDVMNDKGVLTET